MKKGRKLLLGLAAWISIFGREHSHVYGIEIDYAHLPKYIIYEVASYLNNKDTSSLFTCCKTYYKHSEGYYKNIGEKIHEQLLPPGTLYDEKKRTDLIFLAKVGRFHRQIRIIIEDTKIEVGLEEMLEQNKNQTDYLKKKFWDEQLNEICSRKKYLDITFMNYVTLNKVLLLIPNYGALRFFLNDLGPVYQFKTWYTIQSIGMKIFYKYIKLEDVTKYFPSPILKKKEITFKEFKKTTINNFLRYLLFETSSLSWVCPEMEKNKIKRWYKEKIAHISVGYINDKKK